MAGHSLPLMGTGELPFSKDPLSFELLVIPAMAMFLSVIIHPNWS